jgi:oxygen-independent coproporphyrinogen III oxidase
MQALPFFDQALLSKYNTSGPRYTSYPTAVEFSSDFSASEYQSAIINSTNNRLSLYIHIPFCHSLCYYCGCNKIVTRHRDKADIYLDFLIKEIEAKAPLFKQRKIEQVHLGGGTPSFLDQAQLKRLVNSLRANFEFADHIEQSIEIDPREIELTYAEQLFQLGFNRMSIGVQDIDSKVQEAINREQSTRFVEMFIAHAKKVGFKSINIDLIYGLPHQTLETFARTIDKAIEMNVDRVSLFSYAHLPSRFAAQRKIKDEWLPNAQNKFELMRYAIETFTSRGYDFIGMDHFAKPSDELAIAQREGKLHRNFQGYTTKGECDLLGLGVSSISSIGKSYSQNYKSIKDYYQAIDNRNTATEVGITLCTDDLIRGHVIKELMCNLHLDKENVEAKFEINFARYFEEELQGLTPFIEDGLVQDNITEIIISPKARLLIRNICMTFDAYMKKHINQQRFSRVI